MGKKKKLPGQKRETVEMSLADFQKITPAADSGLKKEPVSAWQTLDLGAQDSI